MDEDDDEPFVGASAMSMIIAMGSLSIAWPRYEVALFMLFQRLAQTPKSQARVIWFNLTSLDSKLRIMEQLCNEGLAGPQKTKVEERLSAAISLSKKRNRWVHWYWMQEGQEWSAVGLRKLVTIPVSIEEVNAAVQLIGQEIGAVRSLLPNLPEPSGRSTS